jgi:hypothetical protein
MTEYIKMQDFLNEAIINKTPFTYCAIIEGRMQAIVVYNPTMKVNYD